MFSLPSRYLSPYYRRLYLISQVITIVIIVNGRGGSNTEFLDQGTKERGAVGGLRLGSSLVL
jgi:hypothetical protein